MYIFIPHRVNLAITYSWTSTSKVILGTHLWQSIYILSWHSKYWCNKFLREYLLKYCKPSFIRMQENKARFTKVLLSQIVHTWHPCEVVLFLVYKHRLSPQNKCILWKMSLWIKVDLQYVVMDIVLIASLTVFTRFCHAMDSVIFSL